MLLQPLLSPGRRTVLFKREKHQGGLVGLLQIVQHLLKIGVVRIET